jgi:Ca-activated chloride channel family protein
MRRSLRYLFLLACVLCAPAVFAQPPKAEQTAPPIDEDEIVRVNASEVLLPVTVRAATGQLVTTLARKDFQVLENGREQPLSDLALRQVPVDVVLMVDASSSVASNLDDFRRAVEEFAARLAPEDRVSLVKFDDRVELLQDWTTSRVQLRRALRRVTGGTFTRFNDALYLAAREQFANAQRRHAVVVLSDGIDHSGPGSVTLEQSLRALIEAGATVYCISNTQIERVRKQAELESLLSASDSAQKFNALHIDDLRLSLRVLDASERNLAQLTDATGGRLYRPPSFAGLDQIYAEVAEELRHQYALYYTPLDTARDGRFRRVQVKTIDPTMRVATRIGYFAPHN